ncbi:MAG: PepSY domain-containing protein [Candidatus Omnitrophica bacterium]|nr:PepSY domain-containing protein [Candidatus Omnitrophota bacterium]
MFLRKLHRWIGIGAAIFLLSVSITGVILQIQRLSNEKEHEEEMQPKEASVYTLDNNLNEFFSKLSITQSNIKAKIGQAKLDRVELKLKGEEPTLTVYTAGQDPKKITADADGNIEKIEDAKESFILRLHSGEVFGDAGVVLGIFWGLALVFLTITGFTIYWKMGKGIKEKRGWKKVFWLFVGVIILNSSSAWAGSPFLTDDPGFALKGWEIKYESIYENDVGKDILTAPVVDLNYTIVEHFKLNLTLAEKTLFTDKEDSHSGMADTDFKFKWRFVDEKPDGWWPAMSMAPDVTFPTADKKYGLGDELWRFRIPFQFGKTFGKFYTYTEIGHQFVFDKATSDQFLYGYAIQYQLTNKLNIGVEINGNVPYKDSQNYTQIGNIGACYVFNDHWQVQASIGRTLRDEHLGGPRVLSQVFVQWNF